MKYTGCLVLAALIGSVAAAFAQDGERPKTRVKVSPVSYLRRGSDGCGCPTCGAAIPCDVGCADSWYGTESWYGTPGVTCRSFGQLLPSVLNSLDNLIYRVYYLPCNTPCRRPICSPRSYMDTWLGYRSGCGCNACGVEEWHGQDTPMWVEELPTNPKRRPIPMPPPDRTGPEPTPAPTNPFQDDDLQAPPPVPEDMETRRAVPKLQPVRAKKSNYSQGKNVVAPVKCYEDEPESADDSAVETVLRTARPVRHVHHEQPAMTRSPKNPLRDK